MKPVNCLKIAVREGESVLGDRKALRAAGSGSAWCFLGLIVNVSWVFGENRSFLLSPLRCSQRVLLVALSRLRTAAW